MNIDEEGLIRNIEEFEREEEIMEIIILGDKGGSKRIIFEDE